MKKLRVLALAMCLIMALSTVLPVLGFTAGAEGLGDPTRFEELRAINYYKEVYGSPEAKLATMTRAVENEQFALYVQEFTAEVCVVDKLTGQMLFTNPYDVADSDATDGIKNELLSQIAINFTSIHEGMSDNFNSYIDSAEQAQVKIKLIRNGIRVEYALGATNKKRILPYQIEKSRFEDHILRPMYEATKKGDMSFEEYMTLKFSEDYAEQNKASATEGFEFGRFITFYALLDLSDPTLTAREQSSIRTNYPITEQMAIYVLDPDMKVTEMDSCQDYIRTFTKYSLEDMLSDHDMVGFEMEDTSPAVFRMALEYTLEKDGFQVRLPARGISFDSSVYSLNTIQILPYMGAGRTPVLQKEGEAREDGAIRYDDGYNFIPDGSGAIVDFRQNTKNTKISGTLYGGDFGFYNSVSATTASYQTWRAPVFGTVYTSDTVTKTPRRDAEGNVIMSEDKKTPLYDVTVNEPVSQGYVAFLVEGESLTRIDSVNGGNTHEYHSVYPTFFARQSDSYPLDGITVSGAEAIYTKNIDRKYVGNYTLKYRMLFGDEADYLGMANAFRAYLISEGVLEKLAEEKDGIDLYLDLIGSIDTTKKVLGVPVEAKAELTTFENAKTILDELKAAGVSQQVIRYVGWMNGGLRSTAPTKIKVQKELGGEDGLKELISYVQSQGSQIYMDFDFAYVRRMAMFDGWDEDDHAAKTIDGKPAYFKTYNPIIQAFNSQVAYVVSAKAMTEFYRDINEKYAGFFGDGSKNISAGSLGYALNSSQDEDFPLNREDAKDYTKSALAEIAAGYENVILENGNFYTWGYADTILDIPLDSSNRNTATAEIPFLGIVLHGYMKYTGEAINLSGDYEYTILKTIENGANPYFVLAYDNIGELKTNGYSEYYAVEFATWKETIIEEYKLLSGVLDPLQNHEIINHEILENRVVCVTYANNTKIYLNYNNFAVTVEEFEIPAMGFQTVIA
ncbi:MAG: hypothetical protein IJC84_07040 [Clostridia bacterium]|nr:hypothetical protein [Clostridia bacterium]